MVQLFELQFDLGDTGEFLDFDVPWRVEPEPRAKGLHVSDIIRHIENTALKPGQRRPDSALTSEEVRRIGPYREMGFIWERLVEMILADRMISRRRDHVVRQPALVRDDIHLSPDALELLEWVLEEYKATWRSMRRAQDLENEFWAWMAQMMAYCLELETNVANLFVFFVNGDYRNSGPQIRHFRLEWTHKELKDNWAMILGNKDATIEEMERAYGTH